MKILRRDPFQLKKIENQILVNKEKLTQIALRHFREEEFEPLLVILQQCFNLETLDFSENMVEDSQVPAIIQLIQKLSKIKNLDLSHSFLSERGIILLEKICKARHIDLNIAYSRMSHVLVSKYQLNNPMPKFSLRTYKARVNEPFKKFISPLSLIKHMPTFQQYYNYDCGAATILNIVSYFNKILNNPIELDLKHIIVSLNTCDRKGVEIEEMISWFKAHDYDTIGGFGGSEIMLRYYTSLGLPVIVNTNEWGGHFNIVIGFEAFDPVWTQKDNLIFSDPQHYQKGDYNPAEPYTKKNLLRFLDEWKDGKNREGGYLVALPKKLTELLPHWKFDESKITNLIKEHILKVKYPF